MSLPILLFSVGQGWSNDLDVVYSFNKDLLAVNNIAKALAPLKQKYNVAVGITPCNNDKEALWQVMGTFAAYGISTVWDIISSDVLTIGKGNWRCPWILAHGCATSVWEAQDFHTRPGSLMLGYRLHEVDTMGWVLKYRPTWINDRFRNLTPYRLFRQQEYMEPVVSYAHTQGQIVIKSEPVWSGMGNYVPMILEGEQITRNLMQAYPNTIYITYANNVGGRDTLAPKYYPYLWSCMIPGGGYVGWGLSNQSYLVPLTSELVTWALQAIHDGASIVQFEPSWQWFKLPPGSMNDISEARYATSNPVYWADRGTPLASFITLRDALLR